MINPIFLATILLFASSHLNGMKTETKVEPETKTVDNKTKPIFVPTVFKDETYISKYGLLQDFDSNELYKLLEIQQKTALNNVTKKNIQEALTTIALLLVGKNTTQSLSALKQKTVNLLTLLNNNLSGKEAALKHDMCGVFEDLQYATCMKRDTKSDASEYVVDLRLLFKKNEERMDKMTKLRKIFDKQLIDFASKPEYEKKGVTAKEIPEDTIQEVLRAKLEMPVISRYNELLKLRIAMITYGINVIGLMHEAQLETKPKQLTLERGYFAYD
jgi:hypothetical protein